MAKTTTTTVEDSSTPNPTWVDKLFDTAGTAVGGYAGAAAQNRGAALNAQMELEKLMLLREQQNQAQQIAREAEGRAGTSDAWRKNISAQHMLSPGAAPMNAGPYNVARRMPTDAERAGATAMGDQSLARLQGGNPIPVVNQHPLTVDMSLSKPTTGETVADWAGIALKAAGSGGLWGWLKHLLGGGKDNTPKPQKPPPGDLAPPPTTVTGGVTPSIPVDPQNILYQMQQCEGQAGMMWNPVYGCIPKG